MRDPVKVVYSDEGCAFSTWRNVMIAYFRESATVERMRGFRQTQRELSKQADPVGCVIVSALHGSAKMEISEDTRSAIVDAIKAYEDRDLCVSVVIEVRGFLGTTVRALVSGLILVARPKYPMKIFGEQEDGARWLFDKMYRGRPGGDTRALMAAIEETGAKVPVPA
jgi:hypothetical protein